MGIYATRFLVYSLQSSPVELGSPYIRLTTFPSSHVLARIAEILKENRGEINLPDIELEALARAFLPDILAFFSSPEGKAEYEAWQKEATLKTESDRKEMA